MPQLNPEQKRAAHHQGGPLLVLAGAGSGKTSVIVQRIAHLIASGKVAAPGIAAVTFTNKAAREMKQRVTAALSRTESRGLRVSTFHQLGLGILRRDPGLVGRRSGFSLFDADDSRGLLQQLLVGAEEAPPDTALLRISHWKSQLLSPGWVHSHAADDQELRLADLYQRYERALTAYNAVDFDDLIVQPIRLWKKSPGH